MAGRGESGGLVPAERERPGLVEEKRVEGLERTDDVYACRRTQSKVSAESPAATASRARNRHTRGYAPTKNRSKRTLIVDRENRYQQARRRRRQLVLVLLLLGRPLRLDLRQDVEALAERAFDVGGERSLVGGALAGDTEIDHEHGVVGHVVVVVEGPLA